jgi:O-antigen/teichoic acid export membrane protein
LYHRACQLVAILVVPVTLWLAMFSRELLSVWIGDDMTVAHTYRLVAVLALGTGLNCVMTMPYTAQLAHGWTALSVTKNVVAVAVVIPAMFFLISIWGELGAAATWALLNAGYVVFEIPAMHRRILRSEARRWYIVDVAVPIGLSVGVIGVARLLVAEPGVAAAVTMWASLPVSILVLGVVLPQPRAWLVEYVSRSVGPR